MSNISASALTKFRQHYNDDGISEDDLFYFVYGVLQHQGYRTKYANDLKKEAARIPLAASLADFHTFAQAGRQLADLHVNYEQVSHTRSPRPTPSAGNRSRPTPIASARCATAVGPETKT